MAQNPNSVLPNPSHIAAALMVIGDSEMLDGALDPTLLITWRMELGVPLASAEEAYDAIEATEDLLDQIRVLMEENPVFVPEGMTSEQWSFFREALEHGLAALEAEYPVLEEEEEENELLSMFYDMLVATQVVMPPTFEPEEPVDMTGDGEPEGEPQGT